MKEMEEPFEKNQIGSSAMAYKRNLLCSSDKILGVKYSVDFIVYCGKCLVRLYSFYQIVVQNLDI